MCNVCVSTDQQEVEVVVTLRELLQLAVPLLKFGDFLLQLVDHHFVFLSGLPELLVDVQFQFGLCLLYTMHQGTEELVAVVDLFQCFVLKNKYNERYHVVSTDLFYVLY